MSWLLAFPCNQFENALATVENLLCLFHLFAKNHHHSFSSLLNGPDLLPISKVTEWGEVSNDAIEFSHAANRNGEYERAGELHS